MLRRSAPAGARASPDDYATPCRRGGGRARCGSRPGERLRRPSHCARRTARRRRFQLWRCVSARDRHGPARRRRFRQGLLCRAGSRVADGASRHRAHARRAGPIRRGCAGSRRRDHGGRTPDRHHGLSGRWPRCCNGPPRSRGRGDLAGRLAHRRRRADRAGQAGLGALCFPRRCQGRRMTAYAYDPALVRCPWPKDDPLYVAYHDEEWGVPEYDDRALYEKLVLDGFQAGLSWITILRKRENFRRAFDGFVPEKIARYRPAKIEKLMADAGIVRNRAKIEGTVLSARAWLEIMEKGPGFSRLLWDFAGGEPKVNRFKTMRQIPADTAVSRAISKELSSRGFKFVGPTIVYAFMQATGMVNDHLVTCFCHESCAGKRRSPRLKVK